MPATIDGEWGAPREAEKKRLETVSQEENPGEMPRLISR
jgi:hypothetical protein